MAAQMSTSVQNITEIVIVMLSALTPWAAISVSVKEDSPEMEKRVVVSNHKHFYSFRVQLILFFCKLIFPYSRLAREAITEL